MRSRQHSRRAITNTLIGWIRIGLTAILSIFSMRPTLPALGAKEFGIFLASAGIGLFLGFLTASMTTVSLRAHVYRQNQSTGARRII